MTTTQTPNLLHLDSSVQGDASVSRVLSARVVDRWLAAHPGGTVTRRDLAQAPPPHLDIDAWASRFVAPGDATSAQAAGRALSEELIDEVRAADTVVLGLPLHNFGPPSTVKAWIDHLIYPGLSVAPDFTEGFLGGRRFVVVVARGGDYGEGTPRHGWDHSEPWAPHVLSLLGLEPEVIVAELTLAATTPALAELRPLGDASLAAAHAAIDGLGVSAAA